MVAVRWLYEQEWTQRGWPGNSLSPCSFTASCRVCHVGELGLPHSVAASTKLDCVHGNRRCQVQIF